jgi:molybdenum cofactor guanylyltransferase
MKNSVEDSAIPAGIVLAGGRSTRMGRDKALLPHPQEQELTFVEHLVALLSPLCQEVIVVARDIEQASLYTPLVSARVVTDVEPGRGPLMGIYSGLLAMQSSHAIVTAVDMPYLLPEMITFLLSQRRDDMPTIPIIDGHPQVLLAVYPRILVPLFKERLQAGVRGPRGLLNVMSVHYIEEAQLRKIDPQLRSFVNMNTPEEYSSHD